MLKRRGIKHEVLNAKFHEKEAPIVAQAGRSAAVTIATNMAGRGTDILLGGYPGGHGLGRSSSARHQPGRGAARGLRGGAGQGQGSRLRGRSRASRAAGGLHIIGTERHEARRIDNQLRGRAGRQGDPGSSRFYLSLEDSLMKRFASDRVSGLMERMGLEGEVALESRLVSRTIESAQSRVEGYNFDIRKRVVEYDDVINKQRETIYSERDKVLRNEDLTADGALLRGRGDRGDRRRAAGRSRSTNGTSTAWPTSSSRWASRAAISTPTRWPRSACARRSSSTFA